MYPPQQPEPRQRKRKSNALLIVAVSVMAVLVLCIGVVTIFGLTQGSKPGGPAPAATPAANPSEAHPGVDAGAGTPGAPCSTDRLGKFFVKDGVTYTCKGPKPYRWLQ